MIATLFDLSMVCAAVGLFVGITWGFAGAAPPSDKTAAATALLMCLGWLMYRYVFFGTVAMTPGGHASASICDRVLAWHYNRTIAATD